MKRSMFSNPCGFLASLIYFSTFPCASAELLSLQCDYKRWYLDGDGLPNGTPPIHFTERVTLDLSNGLYFNDNRHCANCSSGGTLSSQGNSFVLIGETGYKITIDRITGVYYGKLKDEESTGKCYKIQLIAPPSRRF
jgi:hypothetical protein